MKKTFLDFVCTTNKLWLCLILLFIISCNNRPKKPSLKDNYKITKEAFTFESFDKNKRCSCISFVTDSIGYVAFNDYKIQNHTIAQTYDRGQTWTILYQAEGLCTFLKTFNGRTYYVSENEININDGYKESEIGVVGRQKNEILLSRLNGKVLDFHIVNDSTMSYALKVYDSSLSSDSTFVFYSKDCGNTWKQPMKGMRIYQILGYDSTYIYFNAYIDKTWYWHSYDIDSEKVRRINQTYFPHATSMDDGVLMNNSSFYECVDGDVKYLSTFEWTKRTLFHSYGSYTSYFLAKDRNISIAFASQFPGKEGQTKCIFYSGNSCNDWEILNYGDGIFSDRGTAAKIPDKDGLSVIYLERPNTFHIINIQSNNSAPSY